ncbi:MAG TPA: hypothetical protein VMF91_12200, partial [Bryobacteraceae bacterium]|nr:hypothetical protein [Bryobacteraceae bacterium]
MVRAGAERLLWAQRCCRQTAPNVRFRDRAINRQAAALGREPKFKLMGWMAPSRHLSAKMVVVEDHQEREPSMG